jgi:methionyl-tRNA formyltransferase
MSAGNLRVVILSNVPEVVDMAASSLLRLGHEPIAAIAAKRRVTTPGLTSLNAETSMPDLNVVIAPDKTSVEPIIKSLHPDLLLSWAFPWRISPGALALPDYGSINFHPSLLPRHRGPNPVAWTIRCEDSDYGATWHRMEPEFDSGAILAQRSTPVLVEDTVFDVVPRLCALGLRMLRVVLERVGERDPGDAQPTTGATDAPPFGNDYVNIDWSLPRLQVHKQVRAWSFTPGTHSAFGPIGEIQGSSVRVLRTTLESNDEGQQVECGDGPLWVLETEPLPD